MKSLSCILALGIVLAFSTVGACSASDSGGTGTQPDAMLPPPGDVLMPGDAGEGDGGLSTWMRFGHLVPDLGSISVCVLAPESDVWVPLFVSPAPPSTDGGAGPDAGVMNDGSVVDAAEEAMMEGAPSDAHTEAASPDGGVSDAGLEAGSTLDAGGDVVGPGTGSPLEPFTVSSYLPLHAVGTFQIAILPAGSVSCVMPRFTQAVTLDSDTHNTVLLVRTQAGPVPSPKSYLGDDFGDAAAPFGILSFTDDTAANPEYARTRFINATVPAYLDAGVDPLSAAVLDSTADLVPLASVIDREQASSPSSVPPLIDALGYGDGSLVQGPVALRVGPAGDGGTLPWTSGTTELGLSAGSLHTAFILSGSVDEFQVLWCNDLSRDPVYTECTVIRQ